MSKLYFEVFTEGEKKEFPKFKKFVKFGVLAGGTALALQIQHRRSYDFDVFFNQPLSKTLNQKAKNVFGKIRIINEFEEELTFVTPLDVKITFIYYPFLNLFPLISTFSINLFHWKDIALDKAYTIGRRAQYRDYVDLFFLLKEKKLSLEWIIKNANKRFEGLFSEKLFLEQLVYFKDLKVFPIEFLKSKYRIEEIQRFFKKTVSDYLKEKI